MSSRQFGKQEPDVNVLVSVFNMLFRASEKTELITGADEPIYLPQSKTAALNQLISTHDYFSSALHEISHWCIAGEARRKLVDFGYWYEPDGRSVAQQRSFESVEIKPQALEWMFTEACGLKFRLSIDNVSQPEMGASEAFCENVVSQTHRYLEAGMPTRASLFFQALMHKFRPDCQNLPKTAFSLSRLA